MSESKKVYHDLLETSLLTLRDSINKYHEHMDDIDMIKTLELIRDIERVIWNTTIIKRIRGYSSIRLKRIINGM